MTKGYVNGKQILKESIDVVFTETQLNLSSYTVIGNGSLKQLINLEYFNSNPHDLQATTDAGNTTTKDIEITNASTGVILKSPNGDRWRLTINDNGQILSESI